MRIYILSTYCFKGAVWLVSGGGDMMLIWEGNK